MLKPSGSRRGRPRREDVAAIDRAVLDAACSCFLANGFDGTTMEAVAAAAHVTKTTLYLRYSDKTAMLRAVLEDRARAWGRISARTDWMMGDSIEARLTYFARVLLEQAAAPDIRAVMALADTPGGSGKVIGLEYREIFLGPIRNILADEIAAAGAGGRVVGNARRAAEVFLGMLSGYRFATPAGLESDRDEIRSFADYVTGIFLAGRSAW